MKSYHIHIKGRVQGVGFRPFIYNIAVGFGLKGTVSNTLNGVHIHINSTPAELKKLVEAIRQTAPKQSLITSIETKEVSLGEFTDFSIVKSEEEGFPDLLITPDFAICESCKSELNDKNNRRYQYPFITCTCCGPRYSIEKDLPYDRARTSMETFPMCPDCASEFEDSSDRRFYSQTNSCPTCKISQWLVDAQGRQIEIQEDEIIDFVCNKISEGGVVAVKGIGGFLLICDAEHETAVRELRIKKNRPAKPFALLYPSLAFVKERHDISESELTELTSSAAPIVLLNLKKSHKEPELLSAIAPNLDRLGVMLPYAPILALIAQKCNRVLLATSANQKGAPIMYKNEEAVEQLGVFADFILLNNREIQIPQDDSVLKYSQKYCQKIVIRRSRGYAPAMEFSGFDPSFGEQVLSMGALLKSTFGIWQHGRCHISQFLGDTTDFDAQLSFESTLEHFQKLLRFKPQVILTDKHPAYFTSQLGKTLANKFEALQLEIQHHEAHFCAVLGENELLESKENILGVVFDGTGMGDDGAVWGGEFFGFAQGNIQRINHIAYFPNILGDKMAYEPRLSALSFLYAARMDYSMIQDLFSKEEIQFYIKVLEGSSLQTSSIGRIFDAVACLLGLCSINSYEGEAAMYLECEAQKFCNESGFYPKPYKVSLESNREIGLSSIILGVVNDIKEEVSGGEIAAKFHASLVEIIGLTAKLNRAKKIAFSGGVFQNGLLVDMLIEKLGKKNQLYFHKELSPNDECISYGQLAAFYVCQKFNGNQEII